MKHFDSQKKHPTDFGLFVEPIEDQARSMVASAPFPIGVYVGPEMRIQMVNQSILDVWGKGNDVLGKRYADVLPELESQDIFAKLEEVYATGIPYHARNQRVDLMMGGSLQTFYFHYSFTPLYDSNGRIYGVMNTAADVTDLQLAKQQVEQSERNFRSMILQSPVAMCIMLGPQHVVEVANEPMLRIWGKPIEDVMYHPIFEGLPDAKNQGLESLLDHVYRSGETYTASERPVHLIREGKPDVVYQNFVYHPYRDGDGSILGVLAISVDVTAQVLARQRIEEMVTERTASLAHVNRELKQSNADLAQFAHVASHDLQAPLRKIAVYTDYLQKALPNLAERDQTYLEKIKESASRMTVLIKDVLAYSEVSVGGRQREPVELAKIVANAISDFELVIQETQATITTSQLPIIHGIPSQMGQLFGNLLSNALKYTKSNKPPVISITARPAGAQEIEEMPLMRNERGYHVISVADNGIGFRAEQAEKIFDVFHRLHNKSEYEGTGIGLALCRKIAQFHGGEIRAASVPGEGSVFDVFLPMETGHPAT